jgi:hypothetical protein
MKDIQGGVMNWRSAFMLILTVAAIAFIVWLRAGHVAPAAQSAAASPAVQVQIPFVGCQSDGQGGLTDPPTGAAKTMTMPASMATQLAYYKAANGAGGLGPAGWHCFGTYGSSGTDLYISPQPIADSDVMSGSWKGLTGPAVQIADEDGGTSGRFDIAAVIARVFPAHAALAQGVVAEGIQPASSFPTGPYPADKLTYVNNETVQFQTPANADGLGTHSQLVKGDQPIQGVAILYGPDTSLLQVSMRLPANMSGLSDAIIKQAQSDAASEASGSNN